MEISVAAGFVALSLLVMADSIRVGRGWGSDGPEAGFYPFYVALALGISAASIVVRHWRLVSTERFVAAPELRRVLAVLVPTALYVGLLLLVGLYVSSAVFLAGFMRLQGKYAWPKVLGLGIGVPIALFLLFERGFGLPLPKGPLENWLGY
jgi:putative tricarboxylic transport membrane protein